jgi:hypothetical protein
LGDIKLIQHVKYSSRGKPKADSVINGVEWQISGTIVSDDIKLTSKQHQEACFVIGTNIPDIELSDVEVIKGYKGQGSVSINQHPYRHFAGYFNVWKEFTGCC